MKLTPQFRIALRRPGYHETTDQMPPELDLPASQFDLQDLLDRARIYGPCQNYKIDIMQHRHDFLGYDLDYQDLRLHELNHLACRLMELGEHELDLLEGLVKMELDVPDLARIINLTHTVDDAVIAYGIHDDIALGKWSYDNDFIEDLIDLPDSFEEYLDFGKIGAKRRAAEHGVFTKSGYVANLTWPAISQAYDPKNPHWAEQEPCLTGLTVDFSGPLQDPGICVRMELPLSDTVYSNLLETLHCNEDELVVKPASSMVPFMMQHIKPNEDIGTLNAFAVCAAGLHTHGKLLLYKAVLEATQCDSLAEAAEIGVHIHDYRLNTSITSPAQYAEKELANLLGPAAAANLARLENLEYYGRDLEHNTNVKVTSYGYLTRVGGGPILCPESWETQEETPEQTM